MRKELFAGKEMKKHLCGTMKAVLFSCLLAGSVSAGAQQKDIFVSNPLAVERPEEVIQIPWDQVRNAYPALDTCRFKVINAKTKEELTYQLEYKGTNDVQNLLVQLSVPAKGTVTLRLVNGKHKLFAAKTYGRHVAERKDDFAWENDRIAFRVYGKALESTPSEMAYGVDVWVKRTERLVLNERYQRGEYHVDHGDGLDYYHVGLTLGAGGVAPYLHDTIWYSTNYRQWRVLDNGPLRFRFQLGYDEWMAAGKKVKAVKTVSLDAGSQFSRTEVVYETADNGPLPLVVGILKRQEPGSLLLDEAAGVMAYWEPPHGADGTTGVACVFTAPVPRMMVQQQHLLAETKSAPEPFVYYHGAAWNKAGKITTAGDWFHYVQQFQNCLKQPLRVAVK